MDLDLTTAFSGAAGLPGVQWLLNESPARQALNDALSALLIDNFAITGVQLQRAKYKPGRRLTLHLAVQVRDAIGGMESTRLVYANLLPGVAGTPAPEALLAAQDEAIRRKLAAPFRELMSEVPQWGISLLVSPLDAEFPQLTRLSDPLYVRDVLAADPTIHSPAAGYRINAIRYRPGERHVLRYQPVDAAGHVDIEDTLYAKIYNSDKGERAFKTAARVSDWLAEQGSEIAAVRPTTYIAQEGLALYPHVSGTPLSDLLRFQGLETARYLRAAGVALRALHRTPESLVELKSHSVEKELKSIASASEHVGTLLPQAGAAIAAMIERARELNERLPQEPPAFTYGDYKADHLWATATGMTLIDFDTCYMFDPAIDLGKFMADIHFWFDGYGLEGVPEAQEQFLAGYGEITPERLLRARLYEALVLTKSTVRRVKLFDADWAPRTARLIARAAAVLDELEASFKPQPA
jgi:aminoglycoside phosphotransferase (APT) family kinase protein